jgi:hypothetical protein
VQEEAESSFKHFADVTASPPPVLPVAQGDKTSPLDGNGISNSINGASSSKFSPLVNHSNEDLDEQLKRLQSERLQVRRINEFMDYFPRKLRLTAKIGPMPLRSSATVVLD